jgi:hypothetical protein
MSSISLGLPISNNQLKEESLLMHAVFHTVERKKASNHEMNTVDASYEGKLLK